MLAVHLKETELPAGLELAIGASQAILKPDMSEGSYRTKLLDAVGRRADPSAIESGLAMSTPDKTTRTNSWAFGVLMLAVVAVLTYVLIGDEPP